MEPQGLRGFLEGMLFIALAIVGTGMWITICAVFESVMWLKEKLRRARDIIDYAFDW